MPNPPGSTAPTRTCQKCGGVESTGRRARPSDACPTCGAIYFKVDQALESTPSLRRKETIGGVTLFFIFAAIFAAGIVALALIGWDGLALLMLIGAGYLLHIGKSVGDANSPVWFIRFLAQPKETEDTEKRPSPLRRVVVYGCIYIALVVLFIFVAIPLVLFIIGGRT